MAPRLYSRPVVLFSALLLTSCAVFLPTPSPTATATHIPTQSPTPALAASPTTFIQRATNPPPTFTVAPAPAIRIAPTNIAFPTGRNERVDTKFHSNLLGRDMPILVYLPPGYRDSQRRYPVLYMLHGYGGPYTEWEKWGLLAAIDPMIRSGKIQPMILVLPEGEHSWWFNHWPVVTVNNDGKPWGDYVWKDVVNYIDTNYRTLPKRDSRAVGGLSSGGQGAYMLGMTHPEIFSIVAGHSPSFREADGSLEFFGNQDFFNPYDPIWLVKNTQTARQLNIWMDDGQDDDVWGEAIGRFRKLIESLNIPYEWHTWSGVHNGDYWSAHVSDYLMWYSLKLGGQ